MAYDGSMDSLPYYDQDLDTVPGLRQRIAQLIAAEQANPSGPSRSLNDLPALPSLFSSSPLLAAELARIESRQDPAGGLDSSRYQLPGPSLSSSSLSAEEREDDWKNAVKNSEAQLEHQNLRLGNLDLLSQWGANKWRVSNFLLEKDVDRSEAAAKESREQVESVNRDRKAKQTQAGQILTSLETRWTELVSANLQLEIANIALDAELQGLRAQEGGLRRKIKAMDEAEATAAT